MSSLLVLDILQRVFVHFWTCSLPQSAAWQTGLVFACSDDDDLWVSLSEGFDLSSCCLNRWFSAVSSNRVISSAHRDPDVCCSDQAVISSDGIFHYSKTPIDMGVSSYTSMTDPGFTVWTLWEPVWWKSLSPVKLVIEKSKNFKTSRDWLTYKN